MIKKIYLALLALLLTACAGQVTPASTPLVSAPTLTQPTATLTLEAVQAVVEPTLTPETIATSTGTIPPVPSGCTVVTRQFAPEPTQQSLFPPASDVDWSLGSKTAALTIIEYGDFQ